jgi:general secretion pathway protein L
VVIVRWWIGELLGMLPQRAREALRGRETCLRVADELVLQRTVSLPLAAERNLRAVLGFEMDRYMPFRGDAAYFGYTVLVRDTGRRLLQVSLTAVPRRAVDAELERMRGSGLRPAWLEARGARLELEEARQPGLRWQVLVLALLAVLLLAGNIALPLARKAETVSELERKVREARTQAQGAEAARRALDVLLAEERLLVERRKERATALQVLHELTRLLPDDSWLSHLEMSGSRVRLRGESLNASELVRSIERSAVFADVSFDGSVTRDAGAGRERFSISATAR